MENLRKCNTSYDKMYFIEYKLITELLTTLILFLEDII